MSSATEVELNQDKPVNELDLKIVIKKAELIGSYMHPAMKRMKHFYYYNGREFCHALQRFYEWKYPDFNFIIMVTRKFIQTRVQEIFNNRNKCRVLHMYRNAIQCFNLFFCRDFFAILRYQEDFFKFERLESFLSYVYDPYVDSLRDVSSKAFLV